MQSGAKLCLCQTGTVYVVAVGFIDDNAVGHLHDASFDTLQLIACSGNLYEQKKVYHRVDGCLTMSHSHGLD